MTTKYAVYGLGLSGLSTIEFLIQRGCEIYAWDDNEDSLKKAKKTLGSKHFVNPEEWPWHNIKALVLAPGIPLRYPEPHKIVLKAEEKNIEIIGDIELLFRFKNKESKVIAITGTNGKSTTTSLISHILKENNISNELGGNIGFPALSLNFHNKTIYVLEVSSFQLDLIKNTTFDIAVLLNITQDHIERHGSFSGYIDSKKKIFNKMNKNQTAIISIDQEITRGISKELKNTTPIKVKGFGTNQNYLTRTNFTNLAGEHNKQNITAAFLVCQELGLKREQIIPAINSFKPLPHRTEPVTKINKTTFINDSKATNSDAAEPAIKTYKNIYWLAGGVPKDGGIEKLAGKLQNVKKIYLFGQAQVMFAESLKKNAIEDFENFKTMKEAFLKASNDALKDSNENVVLFSPACASFDEFKNFEERGNFFKELVQELKNNLNVKKVS